MEHFKLYTNNANGIQINRNASYAFCEFANVHDKSFIVRMCFKESKWLWLHIDFNFKNQYAISLKSIISISILGNQLTAVDHSIDDGLSVTPGMFRFTLSNPSTNEYSFILYKYLHCSLAKKKNKRWLSLSLLNIFMHLHFLNKILAYWP